MGVGPDSIHEYEEELKLFFKWRNSDRYEDANDGTFPVFS